MKEYVIQNNSVAWIEKPNAKEVVDGSVSKFGYTYQLESFTFGDITIRAMLIDGEPYFLAMDIAKSLEYSDTERMTKRLDSDELTKIETAKLVGANFSNMAREVTLIDESGLYNAIIGSKKQEAKAFKKWVTKEVLPSIRKTGSYFLQKQLPQNYIEALEALIAKEKERLALEQKVEAQKPLVAFAENIAVSTNSKTIGDFAKILCNNEHIQIGEKRLFSWLRNNGYLQSNNTPYQKFVDCGYFEIKEGSYAVPKGIRNYIQTLITGKGQIYFADKLIKEFGYAK